jgi:hypothetical protein
LTVQAVRKNHAKAVAGMGNLTSIIPTAKSQEGAGAALKRAKALDNLVRVNLLLAGGSEGDLAVLASALLGPRGWGQTVSKRPGGLAAGEL